MTIKEQIAQQLESLNEAELEQMAEYLEFLKFRAALKGNSIDNQAPKRIVGLHEGLVWMSEDFDEPLEDFKEYV
jgi:hypothetical protein